MKKLLALVMMLVLMTSFAAVHAEADVSGELTIYLWDNEYAAQAVVEAYEAAHPNVKITLNLTPFMDYQTKLFTSLAGAGTLGLGMIGAIKQRNPKKFIVLDMNDRRLEMAKKFGADIVLNPGRENAVQRVLDETDGYGCDVYLEVTGHPSSVGQGLEMICKGGRFMEFSVMSGTSTVDWSIIGDAEEIVIYGSQLSPYCYSRTIEGIVSGTLPTDGVVSHAFPLDQWKEAFAVADGGQGIKVILKP